MAIRINLSDRRVDGAAPQTRTFHPVYNETVGRQTGALGQQIAGDLIHSINVVNSIKERDAHIAAVQWETGALRLLNGTTATGADGSQTHVPGMAQKSWQDYEKEGSSRSPLTDLADYEKEFQNSEAYRRMDGITRIKFDRMVAAGRARMQAQAGELYDRNARQRESFYDALADRNDDEKLATNFAATDEEFDAMNREVAASRTGRRFRRMDMSRPEVQAAYNTALLDATREGAKKRIAALATMGEQGEVRLIDGQIVSSAEMLDRAEEYLDTVRQKLAPGDAEALAYKLVMARTQLDSRMAGAIKAGADKLALDIDSPGGLEMAERAIPDFNALGKIWYDRPEIVNLAMAQAKRLDAMCEAKVTADLMSDVIAGKNLYMSDGKTPIFPPQSRQARILPKVLEAVNGKIEQANRRAFAQMHQTNLGAARNNMLVYASSGNPQGYYTWLSQQVMERKLTAGDYARLKGEFDTGWMRGFKGQEEQMPKQLKVAGQLLDVVRERFGADFAPSLQRLDSGELKLSRFGTIQIDPKGEELPQIEYVEKTERETRSIRPLSGLGWMMPGVSGQILSAGGAMPEIGYDVTNTTRNKISGEQMVGIINEALRLALYDGAEVGYDLVTGEKLPDGKKHRINAVEDFAAFCDRIKDENRTVEGSRVLADRVAYSTNVRLAGEANEADRVRATLGNGVIEDSDIQSGDIPAGDGE